MLLERDSAMARLHAALEGVRSGAGTILLIHGEAGIGKSSLVSAFLQGAPADVRMHLGACDPLDTPRPLGPVADIARTAGGALRRALTAGASRAEIFEATLDLLDKRPGPSVLICEDCHWADGATLDLLRYLGRRIASVPALLLLTYRSDEVGHAHPLSRAIGDLPQQLVDRIALQPLSEAAVAELAARHDRSAEGIFEATAGNPFYVTELLATRAPERASDSAAVPDSIRDAVLARAARLSPAARETADFVSVDPAGMESILLDESLAECIERGVLVAREERIGFRHELARRAFEAALDPVKRRGLHSRALELLLARPSAEIPLARLVHHAAFAGVHETVRSLAPMAARQAASVGSHREAAAHWGRYLTSLPSDALDRRAAALEARAYELYLVQRIEDAFADRAAAIEIRRSLGDRRLEGDNRRWLSRLAWFLGRGADATAHAEAAIEILAALEPSAELAMAYSNRAQLHMLAGEADAAVEWGERAIELARSLGDRDILSHALNNTGTARALRGDPRGWSELEQSLALALEIGAQEHAARAYTNLSSTAVTWREYERADRWLSEGLKYTEDRDLDSWTVYMSAWRARERYERGFWDEASAWASKILERGEVAAVSKIPALTVRGALAMRRGEPDAVRHLDAAWLLARDSNEVQRLAPVACARAELAYWNGRLDECVPWLRDLFERATEIEERWPAGELALWLSRSASFHQGSLPLASIAAPFKTEIDGEWREAAREWRSLGCPYEEATALALSGEVEASTEALSIFDRLGAGPASAWLRRRLRESGVRGLPRARARAHVNALLTVRQLEILALLIEGLRNAEIAERLFLSPKTVDHHVSAILERLDARNRAEAGERARRLGLWPPS